MPKMGHQVIERDRLVLSKHRAERTGRVGRVHRHVAQTNWTRVEQVGFEFVPSQQLVVDILERFDRDLKVHVVHGRRLDEHNTVASTSTSSSCRASCTTRRRQLLMLSYDLSEIDLMLTAHVRLEKPFFGRE